MSITLEQTTTKEISALVDFVKKMVVKEQETADAAEYQALAEANIGFTAAEVAVRDWKHIYAYAPSDGGELVVEKAAIWVFRASGSPATTFASDEAYGLWERTGPSTWKHTLTGQILSSLPQSWRVFQVPAGELYVDPVKARYLVTVMVWRDATTGDISLVGPSGESNFTSPSSSGNTHPEGLSDLIPTSQDYVAVKLKLQAGGLSANDQAKLEAAIANFEAPGSWEDVRQPLYATDSDGRLILGSDGMPLNNPLRVVVVPYRGELNVYYRRLVRDYGIDPLTSRTAEQFEVIKWQATDALSTKQARKFITLYTECVKVFKSAFFNEALLGDPLYFNYCRLFISWMALMKSINERMSSIGDVDLMNSYEITNLLYSFSIYQFDDMPLAYKRRFAKNIESIIQNKGTTTAFKEILGLFGLNQEVRVWKHYLVRFFPKTIEVLTLPRSLANGEKIMVTMEGQGTFFGANMSDLAQKAVESSLYRKAKVNGLSISLWPFSGTSLQAVAIDIVATSNNALIASGTVTTGGTDYGLPEVGFQKTDIDDPLAETTIASIDTSYIADFDEFVSRDNTWETTRQEARDMAFSVLQTKYFSISAALDAVKNGMAMSMFWNTLKDAQVRGRTGAMNIPGASSLDGVTSLNLMEAFVAALTLTLWRFEVEDIIPHGESGISTIMNARVDGAAYPNESSILPYSTVLARVATEPDPLSGDSITKITETNIGISEKIDSTKIENSKSSVGFAYDPLRGGEESLAVNSVSQIQKLWDYKFISRLQTEAFDSSSTYSDWLDRNNPELAAWLRAVDEAGDYIEGITNLTVLIEDAIDTGMLNLTTAFGTSDVVLVYVERMIRFFKAYTTDLRDFSTYFLVDKPATEAVRLMNLLAGVKMKFNPNDASPLSDIYSSIARFMADEYKGKDLFSDGYSVLARLRQQDIDEIIDFVQRWRVSFSRVSPAPRLTDAALIKTKYVRRDSICVATKSQPTDSVIVLDQTDAESGLVLPRLLYNYNVASDLTDPSVMDTMPEELQSAVFSYNRKSLRPVRPGVGDRVTITKL